MEKYNIIKTLGVGAYGSVYEAIDKTNHQKVAIKEMKQKYRTWEQCIQLREVKSLQKIIHPHIIKLKQVLRVDDQLRLVFEHLQTNIYELYCSYSKQNKVLTQMQIKNIIYQVADGLAFMHKKGFFHRDLKPENLLMSGNIVKIIDFGLARQIRSRPPYTQYVSTRWQLIFKRYRAPELLLRSKNYNSPVDIFALGCIMAQLYMLAPLFPGNNQMDQLTKTLKILGTPSKEEWPEGYKQAQNIGLYFAEYQKQDLGKIIPRASKQAIDLMESMLQFSARKRPSATDILKHPYFANFSPNIEIKVPKIGEKQKNEMRDTRHKFRISRKQFIDQKRNFKGKKKQQKKQQLDLDIESIIKDIQQKKHRQLNKANQEVHKRKTQKKQTLPILSTKQKFYDDPKIKKKDQFNLPSVNKNQYYFKQEKPSSKKKDFKKELPQKFKFEPPASKSDLQPYKFEYKLQSKIDLAKNKLGFNFQPLMQGKIQKKKKNKNLMKQLQMKQKERDFQMPHILSYKFNPYLQKY